MNHNKLSVRKNVIWAFLGNISVAFFSWVLLIFLTKVADVMVVGYYAMAQAIALPIQMFFTFKLRTVQITDHRNEYSTAEYLGVRYYSSIFNILCASTVAIIFYSGEEALLIIATSIGYSVLIVREFYVSVLQKNSRMDLVAISNFLISLFVLISFVSTFTITKKLWMSIFSMALVRFVLTTGVDRYFCYKYTDTKKINGFLYFLSITFRKKIVGLVKVCFSMGLVALLGTFFISVPRLAIDRYCGVEDVGYYAALSSLLVVINIFTSALGQVFAPVLSTLYLENRKAFIIFFGKYIFGCLIFGLILYLIVLQYGDIILTYIFNEKYAKHSDLFVLIIISGVLLSLFSAFNIGLSAQRSFVEQLPIYGLCALSIIVGSYFFIPMVGIKGGAYAYILCNLTGIIFCGWLIVRNLMRSY